MQEIDFEIQLAASFFNLPIQSPTRCKYRSCIYIMLAGAVVSNICLLIPKQLKYAWGPEEISYAIPNVKYKYGKHRYFLNEEPVFFNYLNAVTMARPVAYLG